MNFSRWLQRLEQTGKTLEDTVLVLILGSMILLAGSQILLRNLFDLGFFWTDELLRLMVLWLAMAGALAASRQQRHISIAVLDRYLPEGLRRASRVLIDLFTAVVTGLLAWHSLAFVLTSREFGDVLLGGTPAWLLQSVLPIGFGLMSWRYLIFALRGLRNPAAESETP